MPFVEVVLDETKLPTRLDVIQYLLYLRRQKDNEGTNFNYTDFITAVQNKITDLWKRVRIPIIARGAVYNKIKRTLEAYKEVNKTPDNFVENEWNKLFSIAKCKCDYNVDWNCNDNDKIPSEMITFYKDQCGPRLLTLEDAFASILSGGDDNQSSDNSIEMMEESEVFPLPGTSSAGYVPSVSSIEEFETSQEFQARLLGESQENEEFVIMRSLVTRAELSTFSAVLDRGGCSSRKGALYATALLRDLFRANLIKDRLIIDFNKVKRERIKARQQAQSAYINQELLKGIWFDGKIDKTLKQVFDENRMPRNITENEEHITIIQEPGSRYITYVTPSTGTGNAIQESIINYFESDGENLQHLVAVGCDGTKVNTGNKQGIIVRFEAYLERPLQWIICLFHFNELPFRALFIHLDGVASGPQSFAGPIGRELLQCQNAPVSK